jgi:hypothetical protein
MRKLGGAAGRSGGEGWLPVYTPFATLRLRSTSGNNSVVECDLAKVEVAGSNPVSRSIFSPLVSRVTI